MLSPIREGRVLVDRPGLEARKVGHERDRSEN